MGRCPNPCSGGFFRRSPLRTPKNLNEKGTERPAHPPRQRKFSPAFSKRRRSRGRGALVADRSRRNPYTAFLFAKLFLCAYMVKEKAVFVFTRFIVIPSPHSPKAPDKVSHFLCDPDSAKAFHFYRKIVHLTHFGIRSENFSCFLCVFFGKDLYFLKKLWYDIGWI